MQPASVSYHRCLDCLLLLCICKAWFHWVLVCCYAVLSSFSWSYKTFPGLNDLFILLSSSCFLKKKKRKDSVTQTNSLSIPVYLSVCFFLVTAYERSTLTTNTHPMRLLELIVMHAEACSEIKKKKNGGVLPVTAAAFNQNRGMTGFPPCVSFSLFLRPTGVRQSSVTAGAANVWGDWQRAVWG